MSSVKRYRHIDRDTLVYAAGCALAGGLVSGSVAYLLRGVCS